MQAHDHRVLVIWLILICVDRVRGEHACRSGACWCPPVMYSNRSASTASGISPKRWHSTSSWITEVFSIRNTFSMAMVGTCSAAGVSRAVPCRVMQGAPRPVACVGTRWQWMHPHQPCQKPRGCAHGTRPTHGAGASNRPKSRPCHRTAQTPAARISRRVGSALRMHCTARTTVGAAVLQRTFTALAMGARDASVCGGGESAVVRFRPNQFFTSESFQRLDSKE